MKKYIFRTFSFLLAVSVLTSCLKDDSLVLDPEKGHNVIEFANPASIVTNGSVYPLYTLSYILAPEITLPVSVSYSGPESGAPEDITVNVATGTSAEVDAYNDDQDEHFTVMPADHFVMETSQVVIKKGEKRASFNITFKIGIFDFDKAFVLPLKITSASSGIVSGNFNTILLNIGVRNQYDGIYSYKTSPSTSLNGGADEEGAELVTASANSVTTHLVNTYSNIVTYTIDPATNKVTVANSGGIGTPITDPSSNYNPETKVLFVKWTAGTRSFEETYTYTSARP